jgi:hypothetical protein
MKPMLPASKTLTATLGVNAYRLADHNQHLFAAKRLMNCCQIGSYESKRHGSRMLLSSGDDFSVWAVGGRFGCADARRGQNGVRGRSARFPRASGSGILGFRTIFHGVSFGNEE